MARIRRKKSIPRAFSEYALVWCILHGARILPLPLMRHITQTMADVAYRLLGRRRSLAEANVRAALGDGLGEAAVRDIARRSFRAFAWTLPEMVRLHRFLTSSNARTWMEGDDPTIRELFDRARELHDTHRGCIFVTPHLGNWELLPYVSAAVGIPMVVVVRPLDNPYLEKLLYQSRAGTGQVFIPKRNSLMPLQNMLARGRSVGMLPDQSTMRGLSVPFLGRPAWTTPIPALLALRSGHPLVVVASCRKEDGGFTGYVSDPILPQEGGNERAELLRLTAAMSQEMEKVIRRFPDQYFWMHNRWKTYGRPMSQDSAAEASD